MSVSACPWAEGESLGFVLGERTALYESAALPTNLVFRLRTCGRGKYRFAQADPSAFAWYQSSMAAHLEYGEPPRANQPCHPQKAVVATCGASKRGGVSQEGRCIPREWVYPKRGGVSQEG